MLAPTITMPATPVLFEFRVHKSLRTGTPCIQDGTNDDIFVNVKNKYGVKHILIKRSVLLVTVEPKNRKGSSPAAKYIINTLANL